MPGLWIAICKKEAVLTKKPNVVDIKTLREVKKTADELLALGYIKRLPDGRFALTPAGREFARQNPKPTTNNHDDKK
jgi:hypothetical protein